MAMDLTTFDAAMKPIYDDMAESVIKDFPALALIKRSTDFVGKNRVCTVYFGNGNRSRTFANAQANASNPAIEDFTITRAKDHQSAYIDRETLLAAETDLGSVVKAATLAINDAVNGLTFNLERSIFRDSTGIICQLDASATPTTTWTLKNRADGVHFSKGQVLKLASDAAGTLRAGTMTITSVNDGGDVTTLTTAGNITGSAGDYVVTDGDVTKSFDGFSGWCPETVTATAFKGVDRTQHVTRLGGYRMTGLGSIASSVKSLVNRMVEGGADPKYVFMNLDAYDKLAEDLGSKVIYDKVKSSGRGEWGFDSIKIIGAGRTGAVNVVPTRACQAGLAWAVDTAQVEFASLGAAPQIQPGDGTFGSKYLSSVYNADQAECRVMYYGALLVHEPRGIGRVTLSV